MLTKEEGNLFLKGTVNYSSDKHCKFSFFFHILEVVIENTFSVDKFRCALQKLLEAIYVDNGKKS